MQERLEREYDLELITTAPTVVFEVVDTSGTITMVDNPSRLPPQNEIAELRELPVEEVARATTEKRVEVHYEILKVKCW